MDVKEVFASRLFGIREEQGLSRQKVADDLGITRAALEYYEKGKRNPDLNTIEKLATYYDVTVDYLMGRTETSSTDSNIRTVCDYLNVDEKLLTVLKNLISDNIAHKEEFKRILLSYHFQNILNLAYEVLFYRHECARELAREINRAAEYVEREGAYLSNIFPDFPESPYVVEAFFCDNIERMENNIDLTEYRTQKQLTELIDVNCMHFYPDLRSSDAEHELVSFCNDCVPDSQTMRELRMRLNTYITVIEYKIVNYLNSLPDDQKDGENDGADRKEE